MATPMIFVALATCLLDEYGIESRDGVANPLPEGGVFTPGAAFYHSTTIMQRLQNCGIRCDIVD